MINFKKPYQSTQWRALRSSHLDKFPYCIKCFTTLNLQVDHIMEHNNNINLFLDPQNLQTLCIRCHAQKTNNHQKLSILPINNNLKISILFSQKYGQSLAFDYDIKTGTKFFSRSNNTYTLKLIDDFSFSNYDKVFELLIAFFIKHKFITTQITSNNENINFEKLPIKKYLKN